MPNPIINRRVVISRKLFSPADLSDGSLWLDASDVSTITESSGLVSQWNDKFAFGNNGVQGSGGLQPITGTTNINGNNTILWDDDELGIADSPSISFTGSLTTFFVLRCSNFAVNGDGSTLLNKTNTARGYRHRIQKTSGNQWWLISTDDVDLEIAESDTGITLNQPVLITSTINIGASIDFREDGVSTGSDVITFASIVDNTQPLLIGRRSTGGNREPFAGEIGEIIIYDRALSASEVLQVELYLSTKWSL